MTYHRAMARAALENGEFWVVAETDSGEEAVEFYAKHHPDLVLLWITMPDGLTALKRFWK